MSMRQKSLPDDVFRATVCRPNSEARKAERSPRPFSLQEESNRKLCNAVIDRKLDKLRSLLEDAGLDVNARDKAGNTAGHQAATDGGADEVSILISHGLNIDAANKDGNTALHQALMHGNIEVTQCLMTAFPNERLRNRSGFTALGEANRAGQTRSINHIRDFIEHEKADLLREHCDLERRRLLKLHRKKEILYGLSLELMPHDSDFRCLGSSRITASDKAPISLSLQASAIGRRCITARLENAVLRSTEGRPRK